MKISKIAPLFTALALVLFENTVHANEFTILYAFTNGTDGSFATPGLTMYGNKLYGSAVNGGAYRCGTVYSINSDGTGFCVQHAVANVVEGEHLNGVVGADNTLFGTSQQGGSNYLGTIFSYPLGNTNFTTLHVFTGLDGESPQGDLLVAGNMMYGTASHGGSNNTGTLYSINTNGSNFTVLHTFTGGPGSVNSDGEIPLAGLVLSGNTLYGTTGHGGTTGNGTIFALNTNGSGFTVLHYFLGGSDGAAPQASLVLSPAGMLYGTTQSGGTNGNGGTIYSISTNGTGYSVIHSFTSIEGYAPAAGLTLVGDILFGTAKIGGTNGAGAVFMVKTNGSDFAVLHYFNSITEGSSPQCDLAFSNCTLYGTLNIGGSTGYGSIFSLTIQPAIASIQVLGNDLIISGTNGLGGQTYTLLSTTNLSSPMSQWFPVATNTLASGGNFSMTFTNVVNPGTGKCFWTLRIQ